MKILAITNLYPRPGRENRATYNRQQFEALAREHEVCVVAPRAWPEVVIDRARGYTAPAVHRRIVGDVGVVRPIFWFPPRVLRHRYGEFFQASIRAEVRRLITTMRPDVILSSWAHPDGWASVRIAKQAGLPCVIKVVGSDVLVVTRTDRRRRKAVVEGLRAADAVVAVSHDLAGRIADLGIDQGRIHVVPEGLDRELFRPGDRVEARRALGLNPDLPLILFVGNLLMSKGAGTLVEAMAALQRKGGSARCILVGGGRDRTQIEALIAKHSQADRVRLMGSVPLRDLPNWYHACDVVALPSFSEGIPNVLREALACGRPFVASRVGGIPEITDPTTCRLVEPGHHEGFADALAEILSSGRSARPPRDPSGSWGDSAHALSRVMADVVATSHPNRADRLQAVRQGDS